MILRSVRRDGTPVGARPPVTGIERLLARFGPDRPSMIAYVPFGDPITGGDGILDVYRDAGVAVLEIGIPAERPYLDGPEVASSMRRALDAGVNARGVAERLARWRAGLAGPSPALVWFTYPDLPLSAIEVAAGLGAIDGLLMLDERRNPDADRLPGVLAALGIAHCSFISWEVTEEDLRMAALTTGYVMVQARPGSTGTEHDPEVPARQADLARRHAPGAPVVAGFGIHDPATVRRVTEAQVDGVVVGSACIRALRDGGPAGLRRLLEDLVAAASGSRPPRAAAGSGGP